MYLKFIFSGIYILTTFTKRGQDTSHIPMKFEIFLSALLHLFSTDVGCCSPLKRINESTVAGNASKALVFLVVEITADRLRSFAKQCASPVRRLIARESLNLSSRERAFRDDARASVARAVTALRADLARITRSTFIMPRSETPVLKFVVSGPVRSDVSLRVARANARVCERTATLTLCTRAYYVCITFESLRGQDCMKKWLYLLPVAGDSATQRLCRLGVRVGTVRS